MSSGYTDEDYIILVLFHMKFYILKYFPSAVIQSKDFITLNFQTSLFYFGCFSFSEEKNKIISHKQIKGKKIPGQFLVLLS